MIRISSGNATTESRLRIMPEWRCSGGATTSGGGMAHLLQNLSCAFGGMPMSEPSGALPHGFEALGMSSQVRDFFKESQSRHVAIENQDSRSGALHCLGVSKLMLIGGRGEGDQDRRFAGQIGRASCRERV